MNSAQANEFIKDKFIPLICDIFKEIWGKDVFIHNTTSDAKIYYNSNGSMYSYYMFICNSLSKLPETPKYKRCYDNSEPEYQYIQRMYDDLKVSENPLKWMMEFIHP